MRPDMVIELYEAILGEIPVDAQPPPKPGDCVNWQAARSITRRIVVRLERDFEIERSAPF